MTACSTCSDRSGHAPVAAARCALRAACRDNIRARAITAGIDPAKGADLLAHLDDIYADSTRALDAAVNVIDLGWRPVQVSA